MGLGNAPVEREMGVLMTRETLVSPDPLLAEGIERWEHVAAGGDTDAVGSWARTVWSKNGEWFAEVECSYGVDGVVALAGPFDGVEFPGPIDLDTVDSTLGPFRSRDDALCAVADRLLACTALLSGTWEPS